MANGGQFVRRKEVEEKDQRIARLRKSVLTVSGKLGEALLTVGSLEVELAMQLTRVDDLRARHEIELHQSYWMGFKVGGVISAVIGICVLLITVGAMA